MCGNDIKITRIKFVVIMSHIIDADKLLEFVEEGMHHSILCAGIEPVT